MSEDDKARFRREAGWRDPSADVARERTIRELLAQNKLGAAARIAWEAGRLREAADWFTRAQMPYEAGQVREQLGDLRGALQLFLRVPGDQKPFRPAMGRAIQIATSLGLFDFETDRLATKFAFAGPVDASEGAAYLALADHYAKEGFTDSAREVLDRLLAFDPAHGGAHARIARLRGGRNTPPSDAPESLVRDSGSHPALPPLDSIGKGRIAKVELVSKPAPAPKGGVTAEHVPPAGPVPADDRATESDRPARPASGPVMRGVHVTAPTLQDMRASQPSPQATPQPASQPSLPATPSVRPHTGTVGEVVAERYRLVERLGVGGMAVVWRAMDLELGMEIALKIMPEPVGSTSWHARIKAELAISRALTHKNVVRVHDIGTWGASKIISMELLRGRTLAEILAHDGPPPWQRSLELLVQLCAGLRAAHEQGFVHRDIKPENVFVCADGLLKIMDFGIAKGGDEQRKVTRAGVIVGTPEYMSPEQIEDAGKVGPATDLYAVGVMMYELFTGGVPFDGAPMAVLVGHVDREPVPPRQKNEDIPEGIEGLILELLIKDPQKRLGSATELARRLRAALRDLR